MNLNSSLVQGYNLQQYFIHFKQIKRFFKSNTNLC